MFKDGVIGGGRVEALDPVAATVVEGITGDYGASVEVARQNERVAHNPGHGGQSLGLAAHQHRLLVRLVAELVRKIPVEILAVGVQAADPAARH